MKKKILFMCTANSCRSQMAEGIANFYFKDIIIAKSGGTQPSSVHPLAVKVMAEMGIDISGNKSKHINEFKQEKFDLTVSLCGDPDKDTCPVFSGKADQRLHWFFPDPARVRGTEDEVLSEFRKVRDNIKTKIKEFFKEADKC